MSSFADTMLAKIDDLIVSCPLCSNKLGDNMQIEPLFFRVGLNRSEDSHGIDPGVGIHFKVVVPENG